MQAVKPPALVNEMSVATNVENITRSEFEHCRPPGRELPSTRFWSPHSPNVWWLCPWRIQLLQSSKTVHNIMQSYFFRWCAFRIPRVLEMQWRRHVLSVCFDKEHKGTPRRQVWRYNMQFFPLDLPGLAGILKRILSVDQFVFQSWCPSLLSAEGLLGEPMRNPLESRHCS